MTTDTPVTPVRPHISFSQVSMYLRCSMQYYFAYILGLRQRPSLPMAIGNGGHATLEHNSRHKIRTGDDMPVGDLLDAASTFLDRHTGALEKTDLKPRDNPGQAKDRAIAAIRVFRERDAKNVHPAGVEIPFDVDLNIPEESNLEPIRIVKGRIDLITEESTIEDQKFTGKAKTQLEVNVTPQLTLYAQVFKKLTGRYPTRVGLRMFIPGTIKDGPNAILMVREPHLMTDIAQDARAARLRLQLRQVERGIRVGLFIPTDDPRVCSWCGFRERCQSSLVNDIEAQRLRGEA